MMRWLRTILTFLILGAVVNVAVAWGFAALANPPVGGHLFACVFQADQSWGVTRYSCVGETLYVSIQVQLAKPVQEESIAEGGHPRDLLPSWAKVAHPLASDITSRYHTFDCSGWPCRALWCESLAITRQMPAHLSPSTKLPGRGGLDLGFPERRPFATPRSLPLRPIWPGFAVNTIFYAAVLCLQITVLLLLRRIIRRRRGRCISCGYDLRGDLDHGCPECGWNRPEEVAA